MANSLTTIMHKILAASLPTLRESAVMPRLVNSDYSTDAAQKGDTIHVPIPAAVGTEDVVPGPTPPTPESLTPGSVQVPLNHWRKSKPFHLTDKEMVEVDRNEHFVPMQLQQAVKGLANYVNTTILGQYTGIYGAVGTAGTTPFTTDASAATDAVVRLDEQLAPADDRRGVISFTAKGKFLSLQSFSDAEKIGSDEVKIRGEMGEKYGINWLADHGIPSHTSGTLANATVNGAHTAEPDERSSTVSVANSDASAETLLAGDIITFAGDTQTYAVLEDVDFAASSNANVTIAPGLQEDLAGGEALSFEGDHVVNLAFHRDAFAFAARSLPRDAENQAMFTDPITGLTLRLEETRQYKQRAWELDILFGTKIVQPAFATRIMG